MKENTENGNKNFIVVLKKQNKNVRNEKWKKEKGAAKTE